MSIHLVNQAPVGTKLWLLNVGYLKVDAGFVAGTSTTSNKDAPRSRRKMISISVLIEHPTEGLLLYETGAEKNIPETWGPQLVDIFEPVDYSPDQELDAAIAKTGHDIKDIKGVILGHMHLDHAGGLDAFRGTGIPVYVHELELKHAYYSVATKSDLGVYLPTYLQFDINFKTFVGDMYEIAPGLTLRHAPGHTPGLCILQVNLLKSGTWIFTSDQYIVKENYESSAPQGWLARDHHAWVHSNQMIHSLQKITKAKMVFRHDLETFHSFNVAPEFYE